MVSYQQQSRHPDVRLMSTHLFSSVTRTGTQNMVKDWDAKITLGNMENQLAKYDGSWRTCAVEYLLLLSAAVNSDITVLNLEDCWRSYFYF